MSTERRIIRFMDKSIDRVLTVLLLILLLIGLYFIADSWWVFNASALSRLPGYTPKSPMDITKVAEDAIAWITIDDTSISYPVMQGEDNSEYLNKNAQGDYSLSGAIFLDSANDPEFTDYYNLLYGHHMAGGYMFGAIDYFEDPEYLDAHRDGTLLVINGKRYKLDIFAFMETDASVSVVFDVKSGEDIMSYVASHASIYRTPAPDGESIVALSTCKSPLTTERTVLFGTIAFVEDVGSEGTWLTAEELQEEATGISIHGEEGYAHAVQKAIQLVARTEKKGEALAKANGLETPEEETNEE